MTKKNHKWWVLVSTGIMIMLVNIDMTMTNLALAKICLFFNSDINQTQWIISSYLLATALSFIVFGRVADYLGQKRIFLLGVLLFTIASLVAGTASQLITLIIARFFQGLGYAATLGLSIVLIISAFPEKQKGFAIGSAITITGLSQGIGPVLGGIILQYLDWGWIFLINVPLGFLSFIMTILIVPTDEVKFNVKNVPFSFLNFILFISSLGIILCSINQIAVLDSKFLLLTLLIGLILSFIFINHCKKNTNSIVDISLLRNRTYMYVVLLRFMFMIMMSSLLFLLPLYLQNILNFNSFTTGWIFLSMTVFVGLASPITGKLLDKTGFIYPLIASFIFALSSIFLMLNFHAKSSFFIIGLSFMFFGLAVGVHTPSSINGCLSKIPKEKSGTAIGLFYTVAITGAAVGVALSGVLINIISSYVFRNTIATKLDSIVSTRVIEGLLKVANGTQNISNVVSENDISQYQNIAYQSFVYSFKAELFILLLLMLIALVLAKNLKRVTYK